MRVILARLLWEFDLSLMDASKGWAERQRILILWDKLPLMVSVRERKQ